MLSLCYFNKSQSGFTMIEIMITVAIIGILAAIASASYQKQVRKTQIMNIYLSLNDFRSPYQILINDETKVEVFSPSNLSMPEQTNYCQFSVTAPNENADVPNAVRCQIQNLSYLSNQTLSLGRAANGSWTCRASAGISRAYLPQACQ